MLPFTPPERLDLARAFFVLALAPEPYLPMRRLAADRLMAIEKTWIELAPHPVAAAPEIAFADVAIRYPGSDVDAVSRVSFTARRGEIVASVGPSGGGKSSLLGTVRQSRGKVVAGFAVEGELDPATIRSATFELEWPPKS